MSSLCVRGSLVFAISFAWLAGCGAPSETLPPDAAPISTIPTSPAGSFAVTSTLDFAPPPATARLLQLLASATDGPDDPARFLLDGMIAALPEGTVRDLARAAAPYLAAYLRGQLDTIAPQLAPGLAAIIDRMARIAGHVGTTETLQIDAQGNAVRTITGVRFDVGAAPVTVSFADGGLPDLAISLRATLDAAGRVQLAQHAHRWPYGAMLRLGLDRAVVTSVAPTAHDLTSALTALVDCGRLAGLIADALGDALGGSPAPYRIACQAGMIAIASEVYDEIAAIDDAVLDLEVAGTAEGVDRDGDGTMDELRSGSWTGTLSAPAPLASPQESVRTPLAAGRFTGTRSPR
jgi:hypothetical protein